MKPILMRMGCVGMLLLAAGIVDGAGSRPYSSQAFWPLLLLAMGIAVGGMGLGVRAELLDPGKDPETKRPRPCGNTDEAKEVEIAISTKNIWKSRTPVSWTGRLATCRTARRSWTMVRKSWQPERRN